MASISDLFWKVLLKLSTNLIRKRWPLHHGGGEYQLPEGREGAQRECEVTKAMKNESKKVGNYLLNLAIQQADEGDLQPQPQHQSVLDDGAHLDQGLEHLGQSKMTKGLKNKLS